MPLSRFSSIPDVLVRCCAALALVGCAPAIGPNAIDYHSQGSQTSAALWVPPDMVGPAPQSDAASTAAAPSSDMQSTTWSAYQRKAHAPHSQALTAAKNAQNVQPSSKIHLKRQGAQYWLLVKGQSPEELLPKIQKFWIAQGFELKSTKQGQEGVSESEGKVIETQWRDMPASVGTGFIRGNLSKIFNTGYVTREKNKYRTRIEANSHAFSSEYAGSTGGQNVPASLDSSSVLIFISQTGLREVRTGPTKEVSQWELAQHNAFSEALYLQRLMQALVEKRAVSGEAGVEKTVAAATSVSRESTFANVENDGASGSAGASKKTKNAAQSATEQSASVLNLDQPFDRLWFETGMALEQLNFTVEDRDRTKGLYYVRYVDPHDKSAANQGFWSQLLHGRKEKKARPYAINVRAMQDGHTQIAVLTPAGELDHSAQAKRIITLLASAIHS